MFRFRMTALAALLLLSVTADAQTPPPIDLTQAAAAFAEAKMVSDRDSGHLWGQALCGPMFFVDPATRFLVANEADSAGQLKPQGALFVGKLPESIPIADSPAEFAGKRWTMQRWPLPEDTYTRHVQFAHECFHRIQPALHLDAIDTPSLHLDSAEGRLWLELEWRALAAALVGHGAAQETAIRDALAFRAHRRALFPGAAAAEDSLEIAEGVAEYTGVAVASPDAASARWRTISKLADPDLSQSFVRSFAYISGPAYGLLLDARAHGWRAKLTKESDLGALLAATLRKGKAVDAKARAEVYGAAALGLAEADRTAKMEAIKARYLALLVDGPTLTLPGHGHFRFSFRPSAMVALGDAGIVEPLFHATNDWGVLDVTDGALVPKDFSAVTVAAPANISGAHLKGPGWTLDLSPGWKIVPAAKAGSYVVVKE